MLLGLPTTADLPQDAAACRSKVGAKTLRRGVESRCKLPMRVIPRLQAFRVPCGSGVNDAVTLFKHVAPGAGVMFSAGKTASSFCWQSLIQVVVRVCDKKQCVWRVQAGNGTSLAGLVLLVVVCTPMDCINLTNLCGCISKTQGLTIVVYTHQQ